MIQPAVVNDTDKAAVIRSRSAAENILHPEPRTRWVSKLPGVTSSCSCILRLEVEFLELLWRCSLIINQSQHTRWNHRRLTQRYDFPPPVNARLYDIFLAVVHRGHCSWLCVEDWAEGPKTKVEEATRGEKEERREIGKFEWPCQVIFAMKIEAQGAGPPEAIERSWSVLVKFRVTPSVFLAGLRSLHRIYPLHAAALHALSDQNASSGPIL